MLPQCIISDDSEGEMDDRGVSSYYSINSDRKSEYSIKNGRKKFSVEQYHAWAQLIHIGKQES